MVQAEHEPSTGTRTPSAGDPTPEADDLLAGPRGPYLIFDDSASAQAAIAARARLLDVLWGSQAADGLALDGNPTAAITSALRDHVVLRRRTLEKVYEGRVVGIIPRPPPRGLLDTRMPPSALDVELETDEDRRTLTLQGGYTRAFLASGAHIGDIVQIAQRHPIVSIRRDRENSEGRVAEERDFVHRLRLGDQDRSWPHDIDPHDPEVEDAPPAGPGDLLIGIGRGPTPDRAAMQATDRWVRARSEEKGTRLEPGILLITDAEALDALARVALREAIAGGSAPIIVLQTADADAHDLLMRAFPESAPWPRA